MSKVEAIRPLTTLSGIASMAPFLSTFIVKNNQKTRPRHRCNGRVTKLGSITRAGRVSPTVVLFANDAYTLKQSHGVAPTV